MLIVLSPAKNLDFDPVDGAHEPTRPAFLDEARTLGDVAMKLSPARLKKLMGISDKLATLNHERFQAFRGDGQSNSQKPAALAFNGDVYLGLDAKTLGADDLAFAQNHMAILSGLYGLLRPLDLIEPYRLEMGSKLKNPRGKDLYAFWGDRLARAVDERLAGHDDRVLVNLASREYFTAIDQAALKAPVITPVFKEEKDGDLRQLQFYAKRARGLMARWAIENRITHASDLKEFSVDGYRFRKGKSADDVWLFTRKQPDPKKAGKTKKQRAA